MTTEHEANKIFMQCRFLTALVLLLGLLMLVPSSLAAAQTDPPTAAPSIDTDRWLEIDLYWFRQNDIQGSVHEFWDRFQPLFAGVRGDRGVILNIGWTISAVMEWSGNPDQKIWLPPTSGQARWVDENGPLNGPLTGTTAERQKEAAARFAGSAPRQRHGYDPLTYGDVKLLSAALKEEAARHNISAFKVGMLNLAWTNGYGEGRFDGAWSLRHQEAFTPPAPVDPPRFFMPLGRYFD